MVPTSCLNIDDLYSISNTGGKKNVVVVVVVVVVSHGRVIRNSGSSNSYVNSHGRVVSSSRSRYSCSRRRRRGGEGGKRGGMGSIGGIGGIGGKFMIPFVLMGIDNDNDNDKDEDEDENVGYHVRSRGNRDLISIEHELAIRLSALTYPSTSTVLLAIMVRFHEDEAPVTIDHYHRKKEEKHRHQHHLRRLGRRLRHRLHGVLVKPAVKEPKDTIYYDWFAVYRLPDTPGKNESAFMVVSLREHIYANEITYDSLCSAIQITVSRSSSELELASRCYLSPGNVGPLINEGQTRCRETPL
ncbi:hypothetical protein M0802_001051 [Mischocyttarus mexicanus]|nr:hypothetical protein M0802_001051 [Mischocyttarus mexicanus]